MITITREYVRSVLKGLRRKDDTNKNDYGRVLVMAGSVGMAGAAILCGSSVLRTGAGLAKYLVPRELFVILQIAVPEATCLARENGFPKDDSGIRERFQAIVIGPGLGKSDSDAELISDILRSYSGVIVLDADGINDIVRFGLQDCLATSEATVILTPHEGEASRLLGREFECEEREIVAKNLAKRFNAICLLKGHHTLVSDGESVFVNTEVGNPGMATGGSGDVLSGIIAGLCSQGLDAMNATKTAVYLHAFSGDICEIERGQAGILAGDISRAIPQAWLSLLR